LFVGSLDRVGITVGIARSRFTVGVRGLKQLLPQLLVRGKENSGMRKPSLGAGVADPEEAPVLGSFAVAMGSVVLPVAGSAPSLDRD
jgi:hypothetical protein